MALDRHDLGVHLVVHPILRVRPRRRRRAARHRVRRPTAPNRRGDACSSRGCTSRSTARPIADIARRRCDADLERVLARRPRRDRATGSRCSARSHSVVDELDAAPAADRRRRAHRGHGAAALAGRPALHVPRLPHATTSTASDDDDVLRPVPGTGLGIAARRAAKRRRASFADAARPRSGPRRASSTLLVLTKANARSTVHRPTYLDYVGVKRFDDARQRHRRAPVPRALHVVGVQRRARSTCRCCGARSRRSSSAPASCPASHDQKDLVAILETYPRDDLFQIERRRALRRSRWASCACRNAGRCACSCTASRTAGSCRASCSSPATATRRRCAMQIAADPHRRVRRVELRVEHAPVGSRCSPACTSCCTSTRAIRHPIDVDGARTPDRGGDAGVGRRPPRRARRRTRRGGRARPAPRSGATRSRRRTRTTSTRPKRSPTSPCCETLEARRRRSRCGSSATATTSTSSSTALGAQPSLSDVLPRLTNMGVIVDDEHPYDDHAARLDARWIKHFRLRGAGARGRDRRGACDLFEEAFLAVLDGDAEDDGFNRLVLLAGLVVARGRAAPRVQPLPPPDRHARSARPTSRTRSRAHPDIARRLVELLRRRASTRG